MASARQINSDSNPISNRAILIVDDEENIVSALKAVLSNNGFVVAVTTSPREALSWLATRNFQFIVVDLKMPELNGLEFLQELAKLEVKTIVIVMSAFGTTEIALEAIRKGANDYIAKPFTPEELLFVLKKAEERELLKSENILLKEQIAKNYSFANIIAQSAYMQEIFNTIKKVADYQTTVIIQGESGTGKELIARALHFNSSRKNKRFIAINCGAIPENLLESELFGHKRGAFTDATKDRKGLFQEADQGTLFLDEIGELPLHLQVKLLRVLQERMIVPVGETKPIPVDVRIIAATLRDLEEDIINGRFRDDLFYRLNVVSIKIPPLRERKEDIPVLVNYFLKKNQQKLGLGIHKVSHQAMNALMDYSWPGNVRELENCIERAMILTEDEEISYESLPNSLKQEIGEECEELIVSDDNLSIKQRTNVLEKQLILRALKKTNGNRTHAARLLEISHRTLLYKLKEYGIASNSDEE
ncbi:MAG: sigma-54-dependent Fis family transcriptional regulator [Deltaproteobacteria bacterium]|nr:sigma-54-dependent Fis family transcriptional regulator [Deltaproteobacteria bacterium]